MAKDEHEGLQAPTASPPKAACAFTSAASPRHLDPGIRSAAMLKEPLPLLDPSALRVFARTSRPQMSTELSRSRERRKAADVSPRHIPPPMACATLRGVAAVSRGILRHDVRAFAPPSALVLHIRGSRSSSSSNSSSSGSRSLACDRRSTALSVRCMATRGSGTGGMSDVEAAVALINKQ
eukprot:364585-Chlamydomonas_euryale.AAC.17